MVIFENIDLGGIQKRMGSEQPATHAEMGLDSRRHNGAGLYVKHKREMYGSGA